MNRSRFSFSSSTRFKTAAAARNLNVLHIGKCSSDRCSRRLAPLVSTAAPPIRLPVFASIAAIDFTKSLSVPEEFAAPDPSRGELAASNKSRTATIDGTRDGLPSLQRKLRDTSHKVFLQQSTFLQQSRDHRRSRQPLRTKRRNCSWALAAAV